MPSSTESNIWLASSEGNLSRVRSLVDSGTSPNEFDAFGYSPMHAAASYAHLDILEYLVSKGGNVNLADPDGDTPLHVTEHEEAAKWLVAHGADATRKNSDGLTPAMIASEEERDCAAYLEQLVGESLDSNATSAGTDQSSTTATAIASASTDNAIDELDAQDSTIDISPAQEERMQQIMMQYGGDEEELHRQVTRFVLDEIQAQRVPRPDTTTINSEDHPKSAAQYEDTPGR